MTVILRTKDGIESDMEICIMPGDPIPYDLRRPFRRKDSYPAWEMGLVGVGFGYRSYKFNGKMKGIYPIYEEED